jgi:polyisoprenoid-binding protein YceI
MHFKAVRNGRGLASTSLALAIALLMAAIAPRASAATYSLGDGHVTVVFSWSHAGLSRNSGRIVGVEGTLEFEPTQPETSSLDVKIDPTRISTGVPALDRLLRSADFFDAAANPAITFRSTTITATGERTGEVTGDLTIHGTTKPVTLAVTWNFTGEHPLGLVNPSFAGKFVSGFSATTRLLRSEWGLGRGAPLISDEIEVAIEAEAVRR